MKNIDEDWKKRMLKLMETVFAQYAPKNEEREKAKEMWLDTGKILEKMKTSSKMLDKMLEDLEAIEPFEGHPKSKEFAHDEWSLPQPQSSSLDMSDKCQYQILGPDWESAGFE